jgi:outer membrane protein assembly factor BamA
VRVHGNYRTPDEEVLRLAGLTLGQPAGPRIADEVAERLRRSGRFAAVEVRKRFRSLADASQVALVIIVEEHPGAPEGGGPPGPLRRLGDSFMVLPVLQYVDGYGFTGGARVSLINLFGREGHLVAPLTVGSTREAGLELDKTLRRGPVRRVRAGGAALSRENPGFDVRDRRNEAWVELSRPLGPVVGLAGGARWAEVSFGDLDDRVSSLAARVTLDTGGNPAAPRNAVRASAEWRAVDPSGSQRVNRYLLEARGYLGLIRSSVLAVRAVSETSDGPVPPYEQPLLGGAANLRGFPAGAFAGDQLAAASVELRVPLTTPMALGESGLVIFGDAGTVYGHGTRLRDTRFHYGAGAGWYLRVPVVQFGLDVAHGFDRGTRVHVTAALRF